MSTDQERRKGRAIFDAYASLRKIAEKYELEEKLAIPRVVFVGETSSGKSMLVQNFLRFPCAFSQSDVGTRCPILYRLRYNSTLGDNVILIKHPATVKRLQDLAEHLRHVMEQIEREDGFCLEEYLVHIESSRYRDFEILDVPGLISGSRNSQHAAAVERITEYYVCDPTFLIVQLKEATQLGVNSFGTKRIREFCLMDPAPCGSTLAPRLDYEDYILSRNRKDYLSSFQHYFQAFRSAIPKIQQVLQELVYEQDKHSHVLMSLVEEKDLKAIREIYQRYIRTFRSTLSNYIAFRAEINTLFDVETYSQTYAQIEEEYNKWSRRIQLVWPAHQTAGQMIKESFERRLYSLPLRYIGAQHFERIRQLDWIESAQGLLYGVNADNENLEKGEFALLATGHEKFLSLVRLEYHRTTREMLRHAVEASKHARYAKMAYAAHSISHYLRILVESFPPTIQTAQKKEIPVADTNPRRLIYNNEAFLPEIRNSETASYPPATRNTTKELYSAIRGLLLQDITANFFANVVIEVQRYESIYIKNSLQQRLDQMSNEEIARLSQIDVEEHLREFQMTYDKLTSLEDACEATERACQLFDGKVIVDFASKNDPSKTIFHEKRNRRHRDITNKFYQVKPKKDDAKIKAADIQFNAFQDEDEYQLKILNGDHLACPKHLQLYRDDDLKDLEYGFLPGDHFRSHQQKINTSSEKNKPTVNLSVPKVTSTDKVEINGVSNISIVKSDDLHIETKANDSSPRQDRDENKAKWYDKMKPK
ncbi:unnamed protein product [Rotaria socialis]|uniref:Dynamin N-terminal domain-containing protein n=1 Tax=Rotaria socialis TaxID=392032 RepID=A0A821CGZ0_9BILA|nr:unnamed protein product [Rotaria socialis]